MQLPPIKQDTSACVCASRSAEVQQNLYKLAHPGRMTTTGRPLLSLPGRMYSLPDSPSPLTSCQEMRWG